MVERPQTAEWDSLMVAGADGGGDGGVRFANGGMGFTNGGASRNDRVGFMSGRAEGEAAVEQDS